MHPPLYPVPRLADTQRAEGVEAARMCWGSVRLEGRVGGLTGWRPRLVPDSGSQETGNRALSGNCRYEWAGEWQVSLCLPKKTKPISSRVSIKNPSLSSCRVIWLY